MNIKVDKYFYLIDNFKYQILKLIGQIVAISKFYINNKINLFYGLDIYYINVRF